MLASDVENPLLGPTGAAAVFGPQKGASAADVRRLDAALAHWADAVDRVVGNDPGSGDPDGGDPDGRGPDGGGPDGGDPGGSGRREQRDRSGAGAAGGTGYAALAVLGADLLSGADLVLELVGFGAALAGADVVITGEGSLDEQSLAGKGPMAVVRSAVARGIPAYAVVGHSPLTDDQTRAAGLTAVHRLSTLEPDLARSIAHAPDLLRTIGATLAADLPTGPP